MKINLEQLKNHLSGELQPVYIVMGDEALLVEETCHYLKKLAKQQGYTETHLFQATAKFNWQELCNEQQSLSLFSDKKLLELHLDSGKPGKIGSKALSDFAASQAPDTLLLLRLPKLNAATQKSKWFTQLEQAGLAITIWPIKPEHFPNWLARRLQRAKLKTNTAGLKLLAELTEGNLLAAKQSIEKLSLLYNEGELSLAQIEACLSDSSHFDVYALLQTLLQQDTQKSLAVLNKLQASGTEPTLILWVLHKELFLLADLAKAQQAKQNLAPIWKQHAVWLNRQPLLKKHLHAFTYADYLFLLSQTASCDQILKGAKPGNLWQALHKLCLAMCNPNYLALACTAAA